MLYAVPDAVSLLVVKRMANTTKVHHVIVVFFMVVNLCITYEDEHSVSRALVVYAIFSTFAYLVNLLLASRFIPVSPSVSLGMSLTALAVYAACLMFNWAWQVKFLTPLVVNRSATSELGLWTYIALILLVVRDDVVLVRWLWDNAHKKNEARKLASKVE